LTIRKDWGKNDGDEDDNMFHLVSYMFQQVSCWLILGEPKYNINGFVLQESGDFTWGKGNQMG